MAFHQIDDTVYIDDNPLPTMPGCYFWEKGGPVVDGSKGFLCAAADGPSKLRFRSLEGPITSKPPSPDIESPHLPNMLFRNIWRMMLCTTSTGHEKASIFTDLIFWHKNDPSLIKKHRCPVTLRMFDKAYTGPVIKVDRESVHHFPELQRHENQQFIDWVQ